MGREVGAISGVGEAVGIVVSSEQGSASQEGSGVGSGVGWVGSVVGAQVELLLCISGNIGGGAQRRRRSIAWASIERASIARASGHTFFLVGDLLVKI